MTIWLLKKPEEVIIYAMKFRNTAEFMASIKDLVYLKEQGAITTALHIGNDLRVLSSKIRRSDIAGPLSEKVREELAKSQKIGMWGAP